jgi:hypothetical protein
MRCIGHEKTVQSSMVVERSRIENKKFGVKGAESGNERAHVDRMRAKRQLRVMDEMLAVCPTSTV